MGSLRFNLPRTGRPVGDILGRLPRAFREDAERGFALLASVPSDRYEDLVRNSIVMMDNRRPPIEELGKILGLSPTDAGSVVSAAMLIVPMMGEGTTGPEEFIEASTRIKLIDPAIVPRLRPFINAVVAHQSEIANVIKKATLTDQILPSFMNMDVAVDIRLGFTEGAIDVVVPVALVHIDTDESNEEIWFQCSKQQLLLIKDEIDTAIKKVEAAEAWGSRS